MNAPTRPTPKTGWKRKKSQPVITKSEREVREKKELRHRDAIERSHEEQRAAVLRQIGRGT